MESKLATPCKILRPTIGQPTLRVSLFQLPAAHILRVPLLYRPIGRPLCGCRLYMVWFERTNSKRGKTSSFIQNSIGTTMEKEWIPYKRLYSSTMAYASLMKMKVLSYL